MKNRKSSTQIKKHASEYRITKYGTSEARRALQSTTGQQRASLKKQGLERNNGSSSKNGRQSLSGQGYQKSSQNDLGNYAPSSKNKKTQSRATTGYERGGQERGGRERSVSSSSQEGREQRTIGGTVAERNVSTKKAGQQSNGGYARSTRARNGSGAKKSSKPKKTARTGSKKTARTSITSRTSKTEKKR